MKAASTWAATALVAMLTLSACSSTSSSSPQATPPSSPPSSPPTTHATHHVKPTPPPQPPPPHACYRLSYQAALAPTNTNKPAPCAGPHTAVTYSLGFYPKTLPVDGARLHRLVSTVCPRRFTSFVGGTLDARRLSVLRPIWFTPTVAEAVAGAHWFRCEAIAIRDSSSLLRLSVPVAGALDSSTGQAHYGLCGSAEPGTAGFEQRACAIPHTWRTLRTVDFPPGRYPGVATVKSAGQTPCQEAAKAVAGNPLSYQWSYQWPTLQQWRGGHTYGECWAPS